MNKPEKPDWMSPTAHNLYISERDYGHRVHYGGQIWDRFRPLEPSTADRAPWLIWDQLNATPEIKGGFSEGERAAQMEEKFKQRLRAGRVNDD